MKEKKDIHWVSGADEVSQNQTSRRGFLSKVWVGLGFVALGELLWMAFSFMRPKKGPATENAVSAVIVAGVIESFSIGSVTAFQRGPFYLVRLEDGGLLALSCKCTHLGCTVPWVEKEKRFICPCHASTFDLTGKVISGPANRPLDLCPIRIENNVVKVETGRKIKRGGFRPEQVTYAKNA